jgi:signal peptidase I
MGQHLLLHSDQTGSTYRVGLDHQGKFRRREIRDPMLGRSYTIGDARNLLMHTRPRMGDRVLVIKSLYPFRQPDRFDVVVFKNPTDPNGEAANYIKRLIGLPNEKIWLADGDVFAGDVEAPAMEGYVVQRKPEHVQRAVWQPVYQSDYYPHDTARLSRRYKGPMWLGEDWTTEAQRRYVCSTAEATTLKWDVGDRPIVDWNYYNMLAPPGNYRADFVSDVRVAAGVVAEDPSALAMTLEIGAREHTFQFVIEDGEALIRMKPDFDPEAQWVGGESVPIDLPRSGKVFNVEFWHVDQSMSIYIDGERVAYYEYNWSPAQRLKYATGRLDADESSAPQIGALVDEATSPPTIAWHFRGSPVELHRVALDRDLYYKADDYRQTPRHQSLAADDEVQQKYGSLVRDRSPAYGTHPGKPARLGPDHFFMLGDNSAASSDSRLWGAPHPLVATQIDPAPFVVHRRLMLGKAWVVYFPSPFAMSEGGRAFIPDFGRLRFIR